jgi:hypothetical protein
MGAHQPIQKALVCARIATLGSEVPNELLLLGNELSALGNGISGYFEVYHSDRLGDDRYAYPT